MAKMSRGQYEILIEALGESLSQAQRSGQAGGVYITIRTLQGHLAADNRNFRAKEFMERIEAHAELGKLVDRATIS